MAEFNDWLRANGWDPETITATQKVKLQAAWRAEQNPAPAPAPTPTPPAPAPEQVKVDSSTFDEKMRSIEDENTRIESIRQMAIRQCELNVGNPEKCKQIREMCSSAVADQKTTTKDFHLALLRADRYAGPIIMPGAEAVVDDKVIEAAVCRRAGLRDIEKHFEPKVLEVSEKRFRHGLGLQELMGLAARKHGWRGESIRGALESKDFWQHAFANGNDGYGLMAGTTGPSTYSLPNIFANTANKFLRVGFMSVDSVWSRISARRSVNDFKTATTIALSGSMRYQKLAPSGEIKHGDLKETVYTNKADTYAIMLGIARTDLINDDLGALSSVGQRIGRGAALAINHIFWTVFLNNSSFFTSGNGNVSTGGGSALGTADGAAINAAEVKFVNQTDPDGNPVAIMPKIMLVPPTLANTAARWMGSQIVTLGGTSGLGSANVYQGRYSVETSAYMENSAYTGNSTAAWYLLADPADMPVAEVVFVNGKDTPTVETAEADFNQLGIGMRGYIDFGVALQEYRGGVRSAGS